MKRDYAPYQSKRESDRLLTPHETAARLGLSNADTLAVWRCTKRYPLPWVKIGASVRYRERDVEAFIEANVHGNFSSPGEG